MICIFIIIGISLFISGCGEPNGDPQKTLENYWEASNYKKDYSAAYELISETYRTEKNLTKEKYIKDKNESESKQLSDPILSEYIFVNRHYTISFVKKFQKLEIDGKEYKNVNEYKIDDYETMMKKKLKDEYEPTTPRELHNSFNYYVVNENGKWKVLKGSSYKK